MAVIPSKMIPLNTSAPDFSLIDVVSGQPKTLSELKGEKGTVIVFSCNHCPYVKHILKDLLIVAHDYSGLGINFVAISANDPEAYSEDSPERMKQLAQSLKFPFPYLYDETQESARAYGAVCTPDFFVFDQNLHCVYRGQFDDSRPGNDIAVTGGDLRTALDHLLEGKPPLANQKPSTGCSIKWKNS